MFLAVCGGLANDPVVSDSRRSKCFDYSVATPRSVARPRAALKAFLAGYVERSRHADARKDADLSPHALARRHRNRARDRGRPQGAVNIALLMLAKRDGLRPSDVLRIWRQCSWAITRLRPQYGAVGSPPVHSCAPRIATRHWPGSDKDILAKPSPVGGKPATNLPSASRIPRRLTEFHEFERPAAGSPSRLFNRALRHMLRKVGHRSDRVALRE